MFNSRVGKGSGKFKVKRKNVKARAFHFELSTFSLSLPYFTAPSKPRMNNFCAAKNTTSTGSIRIIAPAATL
jgi:hypothetical protein